MYRPPPLSRILQPPIWIFHFLHLLASVLGRPEDAPGTVEREIRRRMHAVRERRLQLERERVQSESSRLPDSEAVE